jgi:uncharacterized membrane protein
MPPPPAPGIPPSPGIPPAPGIPPSGYTAYAAGGFASPQIDIGDSVGWSFKKLQQHVGPFVSLAAVVLAAYIVRGVIVVHIVHSTGQLVMNPDTGALEVTTSFWNGFFGLLVISFVFGVVIALLRVGLTRAALRATRGEEPSFADLTTGPNTGTYLVTAIVVSVLIGLGTVACLIPGLAALFFFLFAAFHSLDKGADLGDALRWSFEATKNNVAPVALLVLLLFGLSLVAGLFSGSVAGVVVSAVLALFIEPFAALLTANVYRKLGQESIAPAEG